MFVREKKVGGKSYFYLVRSRRVGGQVKQENLLYLGSVKPSSVELEKIIKEYTRISEDGEET